MSIGKRISEQRKKHNYSQEYLAEQLNVSRQAVSKWEQDQTSPDTNNLIALAQIFGVTVEYLATGNSSEPTTLPPSSPSKFSLRTILGLIFIGGGVQALLLGLLFSEFLLLLALYFFAGGVLCLIWREDRVIALSWIITVVLLLTAFVLGNGL